MASLPDPTGSLTGADRALFDHMAAVRAHAEGRPQLGEVYVRMFNNPGVAAKVGALGEHLRFSATLPDPVRELVILRYSARQRVGYEWAHHQRPARLAGVDQATIDEVTAGGLPAGLPDATHARRLRHPCRGRAAPSSILTGSRRAAAVSCPPVAEGIRGPSRECTAGSAGSRVITRRGGCPRCRAAP
jgi:alkylhydroperoxidase family enzyme